MVAGPDLEQRKGLARCWCKLLNYREIPKSTAKVRGFLSIFAAPIQWVRDPYIPLRGTTEELANRLEESKVEDQQRECRLGETASAR